MKPTKKYTFIIEYADSEKYPNETLRDIIKVDFDTERAILTFVDIKGDYHMFQHSKIKSYTQVSEENI